MNVALQRGRLCSSSKERSGPTVPQLYLLHRLWLQFSQDGDCNYDQKRLQKTTMGVNGSMLSAHKVHTVIARGDQGGAVSEDKSLQNHDRHL